MMKPYISLPTNDELPEDVSNLLDSLPPANVFRMMANAPSSLNGFIQLAASILLQSEFDAKLREVAILRTAHVTQSEYEWKQHVQIALDIGLPKETISLVTTNEGIDTLSNDEQLVCRVAEEISLKVRLSDEALDMIVKRFGKRQATELILCCSYFNMLSRFLESTRVELEDDLQSLHEHEITHELTA